MNTKKDKPSRYGLHPPYAAVCHFRRQIGLVTYQCGEMAIDVFWEEENRHEDI